MNTIRKFVDVKNNSIVVDLPDNFKAKRVEVIIISKDTCISEKTKNF
ncbi:MAG: hypothetical protein ACOH1X_08560 [Kaistella sp.]